MSKTYLLAALAALAQTSTALLDVSNVRCDPSIKTLSTPTWESGNAWFPAAFTVCAEAIINSTVPKVYNTLLDFNSYPEWNTFVVKVGVPANVTKTPDQVYIPMPIELTTKGLLPVIDSKTNQAMSVLEPEKNGVAVTAWTTNYGWAGLKAEHANVIKDLGDGTTVYVSWETYYGPLAYVVGWLMQKPLQGQFEKQGQDLLKRVEGL